MTRPARLPSTRTLVLGSVTLTAGLALFLASTVLSWPDAALVSLLLVLLPALAVGQLPAAEGHELQKMPAYVSSAVTIGLLAGLCWIARAGSGGAAALGFRPISAARLLLWTLLLAGVGMGVTLGFRWLGIAVGWSETAWLRRLLPRTSRERWAFGLLSLIAGAGEEMVYRGYAIPALAGVLGDVGSAVLTSLVFGVLHAYQGSLGVIRTALLGGVLAWGFLATGSLWPAIAAHALIDVVAGILLADLLMVPERRDGVLDSEGRGALPDD